MSHYRWQDGDLLLFCHLQPGAKRDEWAGLHDGRLKLRIAAPPVEGKANARLIAFVAAQFKVPRQAVSLVSGDSGRRKTLRIAGPLEPPPALGIAPP